MSAKLKRFFPLYNKKKQKNNFSFGVKSISKVKSHLIILADQCFCVFLYRLKIIYKSATK